MISEKRFEQAVTLAAAFVANGDIRLGDSTQPDTVAMQKLADLIPSLYQALETASRVVAAKD